MDDSDDPIKKLLEQTGWSYEDVLKKLEKYKNVTPGKADLQSEDLPSKQNVQNELNLLALTNTKPTDVKLVENKPEDDLNTPNGEEGGREVGNDRRNSCENMLKNKDERNTENQVEESNNSIHGTEEDVDYNNKKRISSEDIEDNTSLENCVDKIDCIEENVETDVDDISTCIHGTEGDVEYNNKKSISSEDIEDNTSLENCVDKIDCIEVNVETDVDDLSTFSSKKIENKCNTDINRIVEFDAEIEQRHKAEHILTANKKCEEPDFTIDRCIIEDISDKLEKGNTKEHGQNNITPKRDQNLESKDSYICVYKNNNETHENHSKNSNLQEGEEETVQSIQSISGKASTFSKTGAGFEEYMEGNCALLQASVELITDNSIVECNLQIETQQTHEDRKISKPIKPKNNLIRERLRLLRKYKRLRKKMLNKKAESSNKVEDIRSKLKEQLELLRNKRQAPDLPLIPSAGKISSNIKFGQHNKSRLNQITSALLEKLNENIHLKSISNVSENDGASIEEDSGIVEDDSVTTKSDIILSNESSFMIVNVVGGYKSPTPEPQFASDNIDEEDSDDLTGQLNAAPGDASKINNDALNLLGGPSPPASGIKPTKTNDVTKIKGWKNKKFAIAKDKQKKPSDKLLQMLSDDFNNDIQTIAAKSDEKLPAAKSNCSLKNSDENNSSLSESPFVSDALDQYLTENAQLNISYEVPKLEAEQTIRKTYIDIKFPEFPQESEQRPSLVKRRDTYKPKTLAEKRKMLIEAQSPQIKDFMVSMTSKQRKDYEASVSNMRKKLIEENVPFTRRCFVASTSIINAPSFVVYNGRRYKVPYGKTKEIVAEIKDRRKMYKSVSTQSFKRYKEFKGYPKKPSLLNSLKVDVKKEKYNPDEWKTVQVKLPKISLEVIPEVGKRIDPKLEHLINFDHTITQDRIDFALGALRTKNCTSNLLKITFPLVYVNNENKMIMRKPILPTVPDKLLKPEIAETDDEIAKSVKMVMNKLLDYVETLECTKNIVNEEHLGSSDLPLEQVEDDPAKKRKRGRKPVHGPKSVRTTTLEMKRLNCKIVSIPLDDEHGESKPCQKEFCKLGCICQSIESSHKNLLSNHCGLPKCMFNCSCNYKKDVGQNSSLSMGTNIISQGVINRLQDEAKKDLAKVEKEFTQTIIKTNNQIIIVGDSKERKRRPTKMPKKYADFVEQHSIETLPPILSGSKKAPFVETTYSDNIVKPCSIKLLKHDLSDIIPFCMVHMLYKCHCRNKAVFDSSADEAIVGCKVLKAPASSPPKPHLVKHKIYARNDKTFNKELNSSRTRGLSTAYYIVRNKSASHKNKLIRSTKKLQHHLESYLRANSGAILNGIDEEPPVEAVPQDSLPENVKRKRKQSLVVLEDGSASDTSSTQPKVSEMKELKLQRRKIRSKSNDLGQEIRNSPKEILEPPPEKIPNIDIDKNKFMKPSPEKTPNIDLDKKKFMAPSPEKTPNIDIDKKKFMKPSPEKPPNIDIGKKKFMKLLHRKNAQLRLLPWSTLAMRYENGSLQLWYTNYSKSPPQLIITEDGRRPSTSHYNIKLFEQLHEGAAIPCDVIRWLTSRTVPLGKTADQILLILAYNNNFWKICGICEKNDSSGDNLSISLINDYCSVEESADEEPPIIDSEENDNIEKLPEPASEITEVPDENTEAVVHENLQENKKIMYCTRRRFQPKKLVSDSSHDDVLNIQQVLWASIPSVTLACKWRVIFMNLGFAYLSLSRSSYTIKYDDVMRAVKLAHTEKITIVLKSEELQKNYPHRNFGIYCDHNYLDKIFVGPYFLNENHDLDTLSFVNGVLVNTNLFNQIKGKNVPGSGFWFHQVTTSEDNSIDDDVTIIPDIPEMIDLTCDSDDELLGDVAKPSSPTPNPPILLEQMLSSKQNDNREDIVKAEKALDALLKTGQLNVNKTIVPNVVDTSRSEPVPIVNTTACELAKTLVIGGIQCDSGSDNGDKMVVDKSKESDLNLSDETAIGIKGVVYNGDKSKLKYIVTNVPGMGYIVAYDYVDYIDVICPITQKTKRFLTAKIAVAAVESVLSKRFTLIPSTFKLQCRFVERLEDNVGPLNRSILNGYHIVGAFGIKNILTCTVSVLKALGMDKNQIMQALVHREQKLLLPPISELAKLLKIPLTAGPLSECLSNILGSTLKEIEILHKEGNSFANEKLNLETRKKLLTENCSKLIAGLPPERQSTVQEKLDQILNFNSEKKSVSTLPADIPGKSGLDSVSNEKIKGAQLAGGPITVLDDSDEAPSHAEVSQIVPKPFPVSTKKLKLTRKPFINSDASCLSEKKVEIAGKSNIRRFLNINSSKEGSNKFVVVTRKRSASTSLLSINNVDLKKCVQMKPEKVLFKDFPIVVPKNIVKTYSNPRTNHNVTKAQPNFTIAPPPNTIPAVSCATVHTVTAANTNSSATLSASSVSTTSKEHVNLVQPTLLPLKCVSPKSGSVNNSSMATLTPVPKSVTSSTFPKINSDYFVVQSGNDMKCFQLKSLRTVKHSGSSVVPQPPAKKIKAEILLTNCRNKTDT